MPQEGPVIYVMTGPFCFSHRHSPKEAKMRSALVLLFLATTVSSLHAQAWTAYAPPERDFKVLFPEAPSVGNASDGSVVYAARRERNDYDIRYAVYRLPPRSPLSGDARTDILGRLQSRARDEEHAIRYVAEVSGGEGWERHVFRQGKTISVHRLIANAGRHCELEVSMPRGSPDLAVHTARDFFNSFQATGAGIRSAAAVVQRIDDWCKDRTSGFSKAFCQYSVCLQPGYEKYPHCSGLAGLKNLFSEGARQ